MQIRTVLTVDILKIQILPLAERICHQRFHPTALQLWLFTLLPPHCASVTPLPSHVGVDLSASCCWRTLHRPPSKRKQRDGAGDASGGGHQRPTPSTVSTCCSIPAVTADKGLHKQPAQILPAGRSHSTSLGFVYGQRDSVKGGGGSEEKRGRGIKEARGAK